MKVCPKCGVRPSLRNERKNNAQYCKECSSDYFRERAERCAQIVREAKNKPCADCGIQYPHYVMDLDHLGDKFRSVSRMRSYQLDRVLAEIGKCEVVCANCHRERTQRRLVAQR